MRRICSWCGKAHHATFDGAADGPITHGICADCARRLMSQLDHGLPEFLETLRVPVLAVDPNGLVGAANRAACGLLGRSPRRTVGLLQGEVTGCANAHLPGGCGVNGACTACTLRLAIERTHRTGQSGEGLRATQTVRVGRVVRERRYRISTEKVGEIVLLRIDEMSDS